MSDIGHPVRIYCSEYESIHLSAEGQYTWIMPDCQLRYNDFSLTIFSLVRKLAESFVVTASINGKKYSITHNEELSAGDCCGERFISPDFYEIISANVKFDLVAKYQGKELQPREYEATYEVENEDVLSDEIDIPWTISNTPEEHIFKGREKELRTLIDHYLSKDRSLTYSLGCNSLP